MAIGKLSSLRLNRMGMPLTNQGRATWRAVGACHWAWRDRHGRSRQTNPPEAEDCPKNRRCLRQGAHIFEAPTPAGPIFPDLAAALRSRGRGGIISTEPARQILSRVPLPLALLSPLFKQPRPVTDHRYGAGNRRLSVQPRRTELAARP